MELSSGGVTHSLIIYLDDVVCKSRKPPDGEPFLIDVLMDGRQSRFTQKRIRSGLYSGNKDKEGIAEEN